MKYIFISAPEAVSGRNADVTDKIEKVFRQSGKSDRLISVCAEDIAELGDMALCFSEVYGRDCIIFVCGGDDAVHECGAALVGTDTPMAVLPFGKSNSFASKIYGYNVSADSAAEVLGLYAASPEMQIRRIDMGKCCGEYFIDRMSLGFEGRREVFAENIRRKVPFISAAAGKIGFAAALAGDKKYTLHADISVSSTANGITRKYPISRNIVFTQIVISNKPLPPSAKDRGSFHMSVSRPCNFVQVCNTAPMYKRGVEDISDMVKIYRSNMGCFSSADGQDFPVYLDGKIIMTSSAVYSVMPKALRLCLPVKNI